MRRVRIPIQNFQFGEVNPSILSRTDTQIYANSAQRLQNFFLRAEGGVTKRSGTKHIYTFDTTINQTACTITVTDFSNIVAGSTITITKANGDNVTFTCLGTGSDTPGTNEFYVVTDNNTSADNIQAAINAHADFTVANPAANVITVTETNKSATGFTLATSSDATRLATTSEALGKVQQVRIIPFIFSDDERYIIALENQKIRCFQISTAGAVSLVATLTQDTDSATIPYTDTMLHEIDFAQSGDLMFLTHQTVPIKILKRTGLTSFQLQAFTFSVSGDSSAATNEFTSNQPFAKFQSFGVTLDVNAVSGSGATITASEDYFVSGHVGSRIRYYGTEIIITGFTSATVVTGTIQGTIKQKLDINALRTIEGTAEIEVTHANHGLKQGDTIIVSEAATIATITAGNINGTRTLTARIDSNRYRFNAASGTADATVDGGGAPIITTHAPTTEWAEQAYSSVRGYPACVTFHENRLWFGGTPAQPDTIWSSKSNDFFNFDVGTAAPADSIELVASIGEINTIRHMISNRDLHVFTSTSEFFVPAFANTPISPTNAQVKRQTPFGSNFVKPILLDGTTIYCLASNTSVAEYVFADTQQAYTSNIISTVSSHLIKTPHQMAVLQGALDRPESYVYFVNGDGSIAVFTSNRYEQKAGWTEFTTNGIFNSICAVDTNLYVTAWYDAGDGTKKLSLMEFDKDRNLDNSRDYSNTAVAEYTIPTADWLNGAVLDVITDLAYVGQFTVASNKINTSAAQNLIINTKAEIGYTFPVELKTNPLDVGVQNGPLTGHPRHLNKITLDLVNANSVSVNGKRLTIRQTTDDMSLSINPVTEKVEFRLLGYSKDPTVTINQTTPLPLQINGVIAEVTF